MKKYADIAEIDGFKVLFAGWIPEENQVAKEDAILRLGDGKILFYSNDTKALEIEYEKTAKNFCKQTLYAEVFLTLFTKLSNLRS